MSQKKKVYAKWAGRDLNLGHMEISPATPIVLESESMGSGPGSIWIQTLVNVEKIGGGGQYWLEKRSKMLNGFVRALAFRANFSIDCLKNLKNLSST